MTRDARRLPPLHLQLAGPLARPSGHPSHDFVTADLAIGEYPTPEDAAWLRVVHDVGAVVSLQDELDLHRKGLDLHALRAAYAAQAIAFAHHPVADGDPGAVRGMLDAAVASVHAQLSAGRRVYLHCNAGVNRAPTVAIAYLHVHAGLSLESALQRVKAARRCVPYWRVLTAHTGG
jgi:protein-tyrosine phosphatase